MTEQQFHTIAIAELNAVYRLACHLARTSADAEDLVQETYLRAFRSAHSFELGSHGIRPWLFKILHNVIHTRGARQAREQSLIRDLHQEKSVGTTQTHAIDACASMDWENVDQRLKAAIAALPVMHRLAFMLWALEGLKYREIAEVMDVPLGTVMSRLARARSMMSEKLADFGSEQGFNRSAGKTVKPSRGDAP